ncbi:E3 ubiquitin-protein ligase at1g12760 [Phtheirospermum japonicum]|uniref:RING-type E3 ubiquitin transferase n=1 Tax=Phtheirospermum japonicum TaxID=374723 RepID=A0A830BY30_9LAMI|nr:E3 ubiquitin-protein ligase at1g12760 [Phtheirospermum japonicum]
MSSDNDSPSPPVAVDNTPLLGDQASFRNRPRFLRRPPSLRGAARFLRRASSRGRAMREPSVRVREAAAEQIEERQSDWAYSRPIVILDLVWNLAFVIVSMSVLIVSRHETPSMPLRLWIVGYAMQCVLHMVCVWAEYKKRYSLRNSEGSERGQLRYSRNNSNSSSGTDEMESGDYVSEHRQTDDEASVAKHLESANTMFSFIWWIIGFYWVSAGGQDLTSESPQLYWFVRDMPIDIAAIEGATKEDIERLPRFKFRKIGDFEKENGEIQESFGGIMTECDTDLPTEHVLPLEDAECCICLCVYDDGAELRVAVVPNTSPASNYNATAVRLSALLRPFVLSAR